MSDRSIRTRFVILALLSVSVVINCLDRANLSIAGPTLAKELAIHSTRMGLVFGVRMELRVLPSAGRVARGPDTST